MLVGTAAITFAAFTARTNTNPHDWARDEAEERLRRYVDVPHLMCLGLGSTPTASHWPPSNCTPAHSFCRRAEGLPVEFGVNYAGLKWLKGVKALSEEEAAALEAGEVDVSRRKALVSSKSQ